MFLSVDLTGFSLLEGGVRPTSQKFANPPQILIDVQCSQKTVFSFKKRFKWSKSPLLRFPPPGKKIAPSKIFDPRPSGDLSSVLTFNNAASD